VSEARRPHVEEILAVTPRRLTLIQPRLLKMLSGAKVAINELRSAHLDEHTNAKELLKKIASDWHDMLSLIPVCRVTAHPTDLAAKTPLRAWGKDLDSDFEGGDFDDGASYIHAVYGYLNEIGQGVVQHGRLHGAISAGFTTLPGIGRLVEHHRADPSAPLHGQHQDSN
jgi:hypothetical protein